MSRRTCPRRLLRHGHQDPPPRRADAPPRPHRRRRRQQRAPLRPRRAAPPRPLDAPELQLHTTEADLTQPELNAVDGERYDAVLLDAPCTGLGNLGRHPELRWNCRYEDIAACAELQRRLLVQCLARVRPGGRLVYAVCSLEPEEGPSLVRAVTAAHAGWTLELEQSWTPELEATDGFYLARLRAPS
jgi:16S rRNA (cytosine967-C5)-methyltransferase